MTDILQRFKHIPPVKLLEAKQQEFCAESYYDVVFTVIWSMGPHKQFTHQNEYPE